MTPDWVQILFGDEEQDFQQFFVINFLFYLKPGNFCYRKIGETSMLFRHPLSRV